MFQIPWSLFNCWLHIAAWIKVEPVQPKTCINRTRSKPISMHKSRGQTGHLPIPKCQSIKQGVIFPSIDIIEQDTGGTLISEMVLKQCFPELQNTHLDRGATTAKKLREKRFGSQYLGTCTRRPAKGRAGYRPLPLWGSGGITPPPIFFWKLRC